MHDVWLSIKGLYDYDPTIFNGCTFPGDLPKQDIIDTILLSNAELPLVYTDPDMMRDAISLWSRIHKTSFERMWRALTEEYNPIHNYDRYEDWKDTGSEDSKDIGSEDWEDGGSATTGVMGYNASTFTDANKVETENTREVTTEKTREVKTGNTRVGRAYGNIGVTTSAQMIQGEIDVRSANVYAQLIADAFRTEFCIMVY